MGETFYKRNDIGVNIEYTVVAKYKVEVPTQSAV